MVLKHRFYAKIASPLHCNRVAVTVQSRRRFSVTATSFGYYGNKIWSKSRLRCSKGAPPSHFSALKAPVPKC